VYLTRIRLNPDRRSARKLLGSPQAMHAAVLNGFRDPRPSDEGRVLWRLDTHEHGSVLYVVSHEESDFSDLLRQLDGTRDTRPYLPLLDSLRIGQRWHFRLTANPSHWVRLKDWKNTKPVGHVTVKQQEDWLLRRTNPPDEPGKLGFRIADSMSRAGELDFALVTRTPRRFDRDGSKVTLATATYEGHLEVTDPAKLRHALTHGIGRAKAYGCGLLTLARPQQVGGQ
jgi:CRISPR system Cascade subunit CasE